MPFCYKSGNGETYRFDGDSPYFADPDELRSYQWSYAFASGKVMRFSRDKREIPLTVSVSADTEREGAELFARLSGAFEYDVKARKPGTIELDGFEAEAYAIAGSMNPDESFRLYEIQTTVTLLFERPEWVREMPHLFRRGEGASDDGWLNFPFNFPFNFGAGASQTGFDNTAMFASDIRITVIGPASNPSIVIGGNRYQVDCEVKKGGRLVIDGRDRTKIELFDQYGNATNVFDKRIRGAQGSGEYIYEKIRPGYNDLLWDDSFDFELVVYDERSFPPCST